MASMDGAAPAEQASRSGGATLILSVGRAAKGKGRGGRQPTPRARSARSRTSATKVASTRRSPGPACSCIARHTATAPTMKSSRCSVRNIAMAIAATSAHRSARERTRNPPRPVQLPDRDEVEQVEESSDLRDGKPNRRPGGPVDGQRGESRAESPDRASQANLRVGQRLQHRLLQQHERTHAGDEHGGARVEPEPRSIATCPISCT